MGGSYPKQFLPLQNRALIFHSLTVLQAVPEIGEIIVVCAPEFHSLFAGIHVKFAPPGERRQDSLYNGLQMVSPEAKWICSHDGARPLIKAEHILALIDAGKRTGAATLAVPVKSTLKTADTSQNVTATLDRSQIWEIQTPQFVKRDVLEAGFDLAHAQDLNVTDDVSLAELTGQPVQLVLGSYQNIKVTTPEDLIFAEWILSTECASPTMEQAIAVGKSNPIVSPSKR